MFLATTQIPEHHIKSTSLAVVSWLPLPDAVATEIGELCHRSSPLLYHFTREACFGDLSRSLTECLLHDLRFGLIGSGLLFFQRLGRVVIRRWRRNIRGYRLRVRSLRQSVLSLL